MEPHPAPPGAWRSHFRPAPTVVRVDDRWMSAVALSPLVAGFAWATGSLLGFLLSTIGQDVGAAPMLIPAAGLLIFGVAAAAADTARLARILDRPPSLLWAFATPVAYLVARKRALDRSRIGGSWAQLGFFTAGASLVLVLWLAWTAFRGLVTSPF